MSVWNECCFFLWNSRKHTHKKTKQKTPPWYFYITKRTLSWNYLPKSSFQLKISPWILKSACLGTHSPALSITVFTSALAVTLRIGMQTELWFSSPGDYIAGKKCFLHQVTEKERPNSSTYFVKTQRLTAKEYGRLTWSGRGSRTARHRPARKHKSRVTASPVPGHSLQSLFPWAKICVQVSFVTPVCFLYLPFQLLIR